MPAFEERIKNFGLEFICKFWNIRDHNGAKWRVELLDELWYNLGGRKGKWPPVTVGGVTLDGSHLMKIRQHRAAVAAHKERERDALVRRRNRSRNCRCNGTGADGCR